MTIMRRGPTILIPWNTSTVICLQEKLAKSTKVRFKRALSRVNGTLWSMYWTIPSTLGLTRDLDSTGPPTIPTRLSDTLLCPSLKCGTILEMTAVSDSDRRATMDWRLILLTKSTLSRVSTWAPQWLKDLRLREPTL